MTHNRVVITGMGIATAFSEDSLCYTKEDYWQQIKNGKSAVRPWHPQDAEDFPIQYAATINFDLLKRKFKSIFTDAPLLERRGYFGLVAARNAFIDAELNTSMRIGCATCSGVPEIHDDEMLSLTGDYPQSLASHRPHNHSGLATSNDRMIAAIAEQLNATGPVLNINGACAGAAQAIGVAYQAIQRGEVDIMLAGGADSVTNTRVMSGLFLLGATATSSTRKDTLCCPFDQARSGLVAGEGGAFLVLESEASAKARGAKIYAEMIGYGSSLDAYKVTAPHPEGDGAKMAITAALQDAALAPQAIDYINAHGTSTPMNDLVETQAIKEIFASDDKFYPLVSSTKSMIGHWISAAAAPEAMATVLGIYHATVPPTINLITADKQCDLDYVAGESRQHDIRYALSNSFGFGGINACLAFGQYQ